MIKWTSNTNLYPRFDVFFSAGYTDDLFPFMSVFSQFLSRGWPKKKSKVRKQRKEDLAMFSSYLLNKTAELFIKFLHCLICVVGIATLSVWKPKACLPVAQFSWELPCHYSLKTWSGTIDENIRNSVHTLGKKLLTLFKIKSCVFHLKSH